MLCCGFRWFGGCWLCPSLSNGVGVGGERARLGRSEPRPRGSRGRSKMTKRLVSRTLFVRREARRTAAEAAALPANGGRWRQAGCLSYGCRVTGLIES